MAIDSFWIRHGLFTDVRLVAWMVLLQAISYMLGGAFSKIAFIITASLLCIGVVSGVLFARFIQRHVFNRALSPSISRRVYTYYQLVLVIHPLQILWRFLTVWCRCYPDLYIVGETRCGTTSVSAMIEKHLDVKGPFTPFVHPLAGKESFYLVGHYWGLIHPYFYRMCFPTYLEKWCYEAYYQRRMLVYDGCAQYLNSAWCASQIRAATPHAVIIACIRKPTSQNISWWRFEDNAQKWGDALGMPSRSASFRVNYPPKDIDAAIELSESKEMQDLFRRAERLGTHDGKGRKKGDDGGKPGPSDAASSPSSSSFLPSWAIPTPNGQLAGLTHMTNYGKNIRRYIDHLGAERIIISPVSRLDGNPKGLMARIKAKLTSASAAAAAAATAGGGRKGGSGASGRTGLATRFYDGGGREVEAERLNALPASSTPVQSNDTDKKSRVMSSRPTGLKKPEEADVEGAAGVFSRSTALKLHRIHAEQIKELESVLKCVKHPVNEMPAWIKQP